MGCVHDTVWSAILTDGPMCVYCAVPWSAHRIFMFLFLFYYLIAAFRTFLPIFLMFAFLRSLFGCCCVCACAARVFVHLRLYVYMSRAHGKIICRCDMWQRKWPFEFDDYDSDRRWAFQYFLFVIFVFMCKMVKVWGTVRKINTRYVEGENYARGQSWMTKKKRKRKTTISNRMQSWLVSLKYCVARILREQCRRAHAVGHTATIMLFTIKPHAFLRHPPACISHTLFSYWTFDLCFRNLV